MSRIGRKPIDLPENVKLEITDNTVIVEGPKGKLSYKLPQGIFVETEDGKIKVKRKDDSKFLKSQHGLVRSLIFNMIRGVLEGYQKELEIVGVGYKGQVKGNCLILNLGFSHPVEFLIPEDVKITTPKPTEIVVSGIDKQRVGQIASEIRRIFPPEPYKGKGIRYKGEFVRRKLGKQVTKQ